MNLPHIFFWLIFKVVYTVSTLTLYQKQDNFSMELEPKEEVMLQTSFGHISINSLTILMVSMAPKSPWKDLSIDTSHVLRQSIMVEILGRSTGNHYSTIY